MPSRSGSPRSRSTDVGRRRRRPPAPPRRCGALDTSSRGPAGSCEGRGGQRLVVHDQDRVTAPAPARGTVSGTGSVEHERSRPRPASPRTRCCPPCAVTRARDDGQAEAGAGGVGPRPAGRTPRRCARAPLRARRVRDRRPAPRTARRTAPPRPGSRTPVGENRAAFSSRLPKTCSIISMSTSTSARSARSSVETRTPMQRERTQPADRRLPRGRRTPTGWRRTSSAPARMRLSSRMLRDEALEPVGLVVDRVEQLGAVGGVELSVGEQAAWSGGLDRGERRAQVVGHRRRGTRSGCGRAAPRPGRRRACFGPSRRRSTAAASPATSASSSARSDEPNGCSPPRRPPPRAGGSARRSSTPACRDPSRAARRRPVVAPHGRTTGQRERRRPARRRQPSTTVSGSSPEQQPSGEVEPDLRLALALLGRAARRVEPGDASSRARPTPTAKATSATRSSPFWTSRLCAGAREEVVEREEPGDGADDRADATEERSRAAPRRSRSSAAAVRSMSSSGRSRWRRRRCRPRARACHPFLTAS